MILEEKLNGFHQSRPCMPDSKKMLTQELSKSWCLVDNRMPKNLSYGPWTRAVKYEYLKLSCQCYLAFVHVTSAFINRISRSHPYLRSARKEALHSVLL